MQPFSASHALALTLALPAGAQSFVVNTTDVPTGGAANSSTTENVAFADVDLDGDLDAVFADGGDLGSDRNRLWINQGGAQGGTVGVFVDDTAARMPTTQDASRDIDFADIDLDGDLDFLVSNSSGSSNQGSRFYVNQGGAQAGTAGFFSETTATSFVNVGVNDGVTTFSSVDPAHVLPSGNWVDWSCDSLFADLDRDGDADLVHTTYGSGALGQSPTRLFLNDGAGHFEEFNPSGYQLVGLELPDGAPALWAEGLHFDDTTDTTGAEADVATRSMKSNVGDLDGDFDVDILLGEKVTLPRVMTNRVVETGTLAFRDRSHAVFQGPNWSPGKGSYEQDLGDLDGDDDLDVYGVGWDSLALPPVDLVFHNQAGVLGAGTASAVPFTDHGEPSFFDYDGDGDLDLFVTSETQNECLASNAGAGGGYALAEAVGQLGAPLGMSSQGAGVADVDQDGDCDVFVANGLGQANVYYENVTQVADTFAPRVPLLEQAPDRSAGFDPTVVGAQVYDNAHWTLTQLADVELEYSLNGGAFTPVPMTFAGGQLFRGAIPGQIEGAVLYRVRATDLQGNVGLSATLAYTAGPCDGDPLAYCTAGTSASGCQAQIGAAGTPSATLTSGFLLTATGVEGSKTGLFFYGTSGRLASPWGNGTSFICVAPPRIRGGLLSGGGTAGLCDGLFSQDLNARWCPSCPKPSHNPGAGAVVQAQLWYRDPLSTSNQSSSLSNAIEFTVCN